MRILFVEDNQLNRIVAKDFLEKEFNNLVFLENGKQCIEYFNNNNVDVIVTDLYMPELSGFEIIKQIRNIQTKDNYTYIIALTSDETDKTKQLAFQLGVDDFITKPISFDEIASRIKVGLRLVETINKGK